MQPENTALDVQADNMIHHHLFNSSLEQKN